MDGTLRRDESTEYDPAGHVVASVDAKRIRTTFGYDATGMLIRERQPISASDTIETTFGYDQEGNRTRFTDGRGNAFWTTYNSLGLPESQIEPETAAHPTVADRTFTVAYDAAGRTVKQTLPGGVTIDNEYDEMGRLRKQTGGGAEAETAERVFDYDKVGRMTAFSGIGGTNQLTYDDRGLPVSVTGPSGDTSYGYTADGNIAQRDDAAGRTSFTYDGAGRLATLANQPAGVQQTYSYNKLSQVTTIANGAGNSRHLGYDDLHRPVRDELKTPGDASIAKIDYGWDVNDNLVSKSTTGFAGSATNTYTYDQADRLTSWNNGSAITAYAYDKSSNRVQNGGKLFTYDQRNRLLTADGAGYAYTARGTLASAGGQSTATPAPVWSGAWAISRSGLTRRATGSTWRRVGSTWTA